MSSLILFDFRSLSSSLFITHPCIAHTHTRTAILRVCCILAALYVVGGLFDYLIEAVFDFFSIHAELVLLSFYMLHSFHHFDPSLVSLVIFIYDVEVNHGFFFGNFRIHCIPSHLCFPWLFPERVEKYLHVCCVQDVCAFFPSSSPLPSTIVMCSFHFPSFWNCWSQQTENTGTALQWCACVSVKYSQFITDA